MLLSRFGLHAALAFLALFNATARAQGLFEGPVVPAAAINHPALLLERWGRGVTQNATLECTSARGHARTVGFLDAGARRWATLSGAGATGSITIAVEGAARAGRGGLIVARASQLDANAGNAGRAGGLASQFVVDTGLSALPADAAAATAAFDACFGSAARFGLVLDQRRYVLRQHFMWSATVTTDFPQGRGRVAVALVRLDGRVLAVQTVGIGAYESLAAR